MAATTAPPSGYSTAAYPADVSYAQGPLERSRLTVFFRFILFIPNSIMVSIWGMGFYVTSFLAWFAVLFTGKYPEGLYSFGVSYMRMVADSLSYMHYITDEYPPWTGNDQKATAYPVQYSIAYSGSSNRLTVFFRGLLVIPAEIFAMVVLVATYVALLVSWFAIMITGRYPQGLLSFTQGAVRCYMRILSYQFFMTDQYPPFSFS